ncbi:hypothetical protein AAHA92_24099 [Salvia divinorum]|uniref:Uncharacterized protein n=1 Tax=Salvia divinorum TaxID=28513 RepID=A0ABD1G7G4_SALDI
MSSKVHSHSHSHSHRNIPFSWENEPGVSKAARPQDHHRKLLPPPPCPPENPSRVSLHIPLPPCAFQPPSRSNSKKGTRKIDDPFLIAYKEVTKSTKKGKPCSRPKKGVMKNMSIFSCKSSCGVSEGNAVRLSQLPLSRD